MGDSNFRFAAYLLAYDDPVAVSSPLRRDVDWTRRQDNLVVSRPLSDKYTVDPNSSKVIFNGLRTITLDGTTALSLTPSTLDQSRYRYSYVSGTAPGFRTDRGVNLTGVSVALTINTNGSLGFAAASGTPFASTQVGDQVFIPGLSTGDAMGVFDETNTGYWQVLAVTDSKTLVLGRLLGTQGFGLTQTVVPAAQLDVQVFSAAGVQVGDKVDVSAGFAQPAIQTYNIIAVTAKRVEVRSTLPLGTQASVIPGVAGFNVYSSLKRFLWIEADQPAVVQCNGDSGLTQRMDPWAAGDKEMVAVYSKTGAVWSLTMVNRSSNPMQLKVISVE